MHTLPISAIANDSFLLLPPDNLLAKRSAYMNKAVARNTTSTFAVNSFLGTPFNRP